MYLNYIGEPYKRGYEIATAVEKELPCPDRHEETRKRIKNFLKTHRRSTFLFDGRRNKCLIKKSHTIASGASAKAIGDIEFCAWIVRGVKDPLDLKELAEAVGFIHDTEVFHIKTFSRK